jgi:proteasome beta subunit
MEFHAANSALSGDFVALLKQRGLLSDSIPQRGSESEPTTQTQATTILGFKFRDGVLIAGDRRATAGHTVMYDRVDKVLEIDRHSVMAIAGVLDTASEMARVLEHSFQFYRRSQLQEMSVEAKVRALSKLLRDNLGLVIQGVGVVAPLFATYDLANHDPAKVFFYDAMGAQFEAADYAAGGSGGPAVRSVLYYENTFGSSPLRDRKEIDAIRLAMRALDTAAESDTATGGIDRHAKIFPIIKLIGREGITTVPQERLAELYRSELA